MKIYDISQEVFGCAVYPGDPAPEKRTVCSMENGDEYNLTVFSMCAHNGTHADAPAHFIKDGKSIGELPLFKTVGKAYVAEHGGVLTAGDAENILNKARKADSCAAYRILIKGNAYITEEAAHVFAQAKIHLLGVESQTVGPADAPMAVHKILLGAETVILEGIRLGGVPEGTYLLNAAPLNLGGCDGAPCRAILLEI